MVTSWHRKHLDLSGTLRILPAARPSNAFVGAELTFAAGQAVKWRRSFTRLIQICAMVDNWYYGRILRYHAVSHFSKQNGVAIVVLHGVWMAMDVAQCQVLTKTAEQGGNFRLLLKSKWTALSRLWLKGSSFPPKWFFQNGHGLSTGYWDLDRFGLSTLASM